VLLFVLLRTDALGFWQFKRGIAEAHDVTQLDLSLQRCLSGYKTSTGYTSEAAVRDWLNQRLITLRSGSGQ
jgi:hypothetical protein